MTNQATLQKIYAPAATTVSYLKETYTFKPGKSKGEFVGEVSPEAAAFFLRQPSSFRSTPFPVPKPGEQPERRRAIRPKIQTIAHGDDEDSGPKNPKPRNSKQTRDFMKRLMETDAARVENHFKALEPTAPARDSATAQSSLPPISEGEGPTVQEGPKTQELLTPHDVVPDMASTHWKTLEAFAKESKNPAVLQQMQVLEQARPEPRSGLLAAIERRLTEIGGAR